MNTLATTAQDTSLRTVELTMSPPYVGDGTAIYDLTGGTFAADNEYIAMYDTATFAHTRAPILSTATFILETRPAALLPIPSRTFRFNIGIINGTGTSRLYIDGGNLSTSSIEVDEFQHLILGNTSPLSPNQAH